LILQNVLDVIHKRKRLNCRCASMNCFFCYKSSDEHGTSC